MIVVATFRTEHTNGPTIYRDEWKHAETPEEAQRIYDEFLEQEDIYTASIGQVVQSTDYIPTSAVSKINFLLLREQKEKLIEVIGKVPTTLASLEGLVHLLDSIQDEAVALGVKTEIEVFGKSKE